MDTGCPSFPIYTTMIMTSGGLTPNLVLNLVPVDVPFVLFTVVVKEAKDLGVTGGHPMIVRELPLRLGCAGYADGQHGKPTEKPPRRKGVLNRDSSLKLKVYKQGERSHWCVCFQHQKVE